MPKGGDRNTQNEYFGRKRPALFFLEQLFFCFLLAARHLNAIHGRLPVTSNSLKRI
jgi:hypothetical protein